MVHIYSFTVKNVFKILQICFVCTVIDRQQKIFAFTTIIKKKTQLKDYNTMYNGARSM
jgi:hypothetical protein